MIRIALAVAMLLPVLVAAQEPTYGAVLAQHLAGFKVYPESARNHGIEGDGIVRLRVDPVGNIVGYEFVKEPGHPVLKHALHQMVKNAHPVPKPPVELFEGEEVVEFMFPVAFRTEGNLQNLSGIQEDFMSAITDAYEKNAVDTGE